jgi:hypothetical protein
MRNERGGWKRLGWSWTISASRVGDVAFDTLNAVFDSQQPGAEPPLGVFGAEFDSERLARDDLGWELPLDDQARQPRDHQPPVEDQRADHHAGENEQQIAAADHRAAEDEGEEGQVIPAFASQPRAAADGHRVKEPKNQRTKNQEPNHKQILRTEWTKF